LIVGIVAVGGREATVDLTVQGRADAQRVVRAVIDTGFNGWLTMPPDLVRELALVQRGEERAVLADGSQVSVAVHQATVMWDGRALRLPVHSTGGAPLIGMALLRGYEVFVQVVDGGAVRITALGTG